MNNIFPVPVQGLPEADIPIEGLTAYLSQSETHQTLYMLFEKDVQLLEHQHDDQVGFVLEGKIEITQNGNTTTYTKGDRYHIPAGTKHSCKIYAGYADITLFMQPDRYAKKSNTTR